MCVQGVYQSGVKVVSAPDGAVRVVEQGAEVARVIQTQSPVQGTNTPAQWAMVMNIQHSLRAMHTLCPDPKV